MTEEEVRLAVGSLLHDVGKVVYRQGGEKCRHSQSGYEFLKEQAGVADEEILQCVRYHHADALGRAGLKEDALAYIVYIADNIASAADRREKLSEEAGFEIHTALQPVFNILNGNSQSLSYRATDLNPSGEINYPVEGKGSFDESQYRRILYNLTDNLKGIVLQPEYINSLLEVLEANLTFVPSSTSRRELADISLYDHLKLTAAVAGCILAYVRDQGITDYRAELFLGANVFYGKKAFLLFSMDMSGIQGFIYTIATEKALRTLRSRSFYLEIMMEHIIDLLLDRVHLSRANLIYSGGGHCYLLLANTEEVKKTIGDFLDEMNHWLLDTFQISLYLAGGYAECSCNDLKNIPDGSYAALFQSISAQIAAKKASRYTAADILALNHADAADYGRECTVCKRLGEADGRGVCPICRAIEEFSQRVLDADFFSVVSKEADGGLPLPGGYALVADDEASLRERMQASDGFVRAYGKNKMYTGKHIATKLWVGDYSAGSSFEEFAKRAEGIDRIAVLRADVDNLGQTFVSGFEGEKSGNRYVTLSRTATLSRQLSLFFKLYINRILEQPEFSIDGGKRGRRNVAIVYSGGDDLFLVGAWNEVIEVAVDIQRALKRYTENTLTISAGIGIYPHSYPISVIAQEVAEMEEKSKRMPHKNAVTLFEDGETHSEDSIEGISDGTYSWEELVQAVLGEKYALVDEFFFSSEDRGKAFLYNLLELIRGRGESINFARYVYLLSRMEPDREAAPEQKQLYDKFSRQMYQWIKSERDCRQLKTAIQLYAYLHRETEG